MPEYRTLDFPNTPQGQADKIATVNALARQGWRVVSETIETGHIRGGEACCLGSICIPLAFLAGRTSGTIHVTLEREVEEGELPERRRLRPYRPAERQEDIRHITEQGVVPGRSYVTSFDVELFGGERVPVGSLGVIPPGTRVTVASIWSEDWIQIETEHGERGFVRKDDLELESA